MMLLIKEADYRIELHNDNYQLFYGRLKLLDNIDFHLPGSHNVENLTAAIIVCLKLNINYSSILQGTKTYKGVKRRFEYIINLKDFIFIDDYAHHPKEIMVLLRSIKDIYPGESVTVIFQPHLFSRTRDLAYEFAESLSIADRIYLLPIYPAREKPIENISSTTILHKIRNTEKNTI